MGKYIDAVLAKGLPKKDLKNANKVDLWAFGWAGTLLAGSLAHAVFGLTSLAPFLVIGVINLGCGIMLIRSYVRMVTQIDEMERKIQFDALALAVGMAMLAYGAGTILQAASLLDQIQASWLLTLMALSYCVGLIVGRIRMA